MAKVWFITGAGRGFGREFAKAALGRGDKVAATARKASDLEDLQSEYGEAFLPLVLDVTEREAVFAAVAAAHAAFGSLDVVVNNAGYGLFGMVEELTEAQLRQQLEVNLFGPFHVVQAVLPILREQGSGHIIQVSTIGGIAAFANLGGYNASKWALEALTESLAQEVAGFGIKVSLIEPGPFSTDWSGSSAAHAEALPAYDAARAAREATRSASVVGDPAATGPAILKLVDAEEPPLRVLFGIQPTRIVGPLYEARLKTWSEWEWLSVEANG